MSGKINTALKLYDAITNALIVAGVDKEIARKYADFAAQMYDHIESRPQLQSALEGAKSSYETISETGGYIMRARLSNNAAAMGFESIAEGFAASSRVSAGGAVSGFIDYFTGIAKGSGIEMNECAIAITKIIEDVLITLALMETVVGTWVAVLHALTVGSDTKKFVQACGS